MVKQMRMLLGAKMRMGWSGRMTLKLWSIGMRSFRNGNAGWWVGVNNYAYLALVPFRCTHSFSRNATQIAIVSGRNIAGPTDQ